MSRSPLSNALEATIVPPSQGLVSTLRSVLASTTPAIKYTKIDCSVKFLPAIITVSSALPSFCLLYTSDAADEEDSVDLGGRRIIKKKKQHKKKEQPNHISK